MAAHRPYFVSLNQPTRGGTRVAEGQTYGTGVTRRKGSAARRYVCLREDVLQTAAVVIHFISVLLAFYGVCAWSGGPNEPAEHKEVRKKTVRLEYSLINMRSEALKQPPVPLSYLKVNPPGCVTRLNQTSG